MKVASLLPWRLAGLGLLGFIAGVSIQAQTTNPIPSAQSAGAKEAAALVRLRCEYSVDPLGIDVAAPRLFWELTSGLRGERQIAYQVLASSSAELLSRDRGDLWDTGRVESDQTSHVTFAGKALVSSQQVFWKVRAWTSQSGALGWSAPATWTMGVLSPEAWKARWIVAPWTSEALRLRRGFVVRDNLRRALLHVSGMGEYEAFLNGGKVGEDLLSPGWTNFDRTTLYDTRDVTSLLQAGRNAIGLELGNGMYNVVRRNRFAKFVRTFGPLRAIAQLELQYADGSSEVVGTDDSWRVDRGPVTFNSIYGGEDYDARLAAPDWAKASFNDGAWAKAVYLVRPDNTLRGHHFSAEPIRPVEKRKPVSVRELSPGVVLYDFGQNASFMPRFVVRGPSGSTVRLTPGEVVNEDGTIDRGTMGGAHRGSAWWQYTKGTDGEESWFPQFYYVGSRYLSVELLPATTGGERPQIGALESVIVHSAAEPIGTFSTSNPLLNRIRDLVRWAQRSNMVSVLTDCPHREKLGWIEQYHLNGPSIRYEFDVARIYTKGMQDMAASQTADGMVPNVAPEYPEFKGFFRTAAEWGAAFILVPWQQYQFTGDTVMLREHYVAMKRYFAYLESRTKDGLLAEGLGDWYDYDMDKKGRAGLTPAPITATAFYFHDAEILGKIAGVLGHASEANEFAAKAQRIRERYNQEFYHPESGTYSTGSQAALALPLALHIARPEWRASVVEKLVQDVEQRGYATAGDIGFRFLLQALSENGRSDVIYRLMNQDEKPGYGYQLKQGATALTESWNASRGASHNHFMLGQVIEWFYQDLAGITADPEGPGFKKVVIRPQPPAGLEWVEAAYHSLHGPITVRWEHHANRFRLAVTVPANTSATVLLPSQAGTAVTESGAAVETQPGIRWLRRDGDRSVYQIESGSYLFESTW